MKRNKEEMRKAGVANLLSDWLKYYRRERKCANERIVRVMLIVGEVWLSVMQVYVPTNDSSIEEKESFFNSLQEEIATGNSKDLLMVIGDWNPRIGNDQEVWVRFWEVMEKKYVKIMG